MYTTYIVKHNEGDTMKSIVNFRDLGGYQTKDGRILKHNVLLRSGELSQVSHEDITILCNQYALQTVIDFRGTHEIQDAQDIQIQDVSIINIDIMKDFDHDALGLKDLVSQSNALDLKEAMRILYKEMVLNESSQAGYRQFFEILLRQEQGALLFHCFAGKDRTGIAAAYILKMFGVHNDDIYNDYLLTNENRKEANAIIIKQALAQGLPQASASRLESLLCVDESYLDTVFQTIDTHFNSFDTYLETILGIDKIKKQQLIELYTQKL